VNANLDIPVFDLRSAVPNWWAGIEGSKVGTMSLGDAVADMTFIDVYEEG
jgi:hypothetical protein